MTEKADKFIDITGEVCPMTSIKTKMKLKGMQPGGILEVRVSEGEPIDNLPRTIEREGHKVLEINKEDSFYTVRIRRG
ncbi:MAG: sulfurtransferase TusA family protein [Candidatus Mycalebacterium zealandia]|nr:MAG: sulfurtransferase TusA family protein [Candidatus Mycalebacterium zealandia]